jgi:hypothetical protein
LRETVERTAANIKRPDTEFYLSLDEDDTESIEVARSLAGGHVIPLVGPREDSLGAKYNRVVGKGDVYLAMVDYSPILTPGFDQMFLDAANLFADGMGGVYSHLANLSFPALQACTHKLVEKMGYWYPEFFAYWFIDHWLDDILRMTDRIAFVPVVADFVSRRPDSTLELRDLAFWAAWFDVSYKRRRKIAMDIIWDKEFIEPHWRKLILEGRTALIEERSMMINAQCRQQATQVQQVRGEAGIDGRYERILRRAVDEMKVMVKELQEAA